MATASTIENRYAVCVGINRYKDSNALPPLRYPENDARAVDALLGRLGFEPKNRRLLLGDIASFEAIKATLTTFGAVKPKTNDLVIFYFAGYSLDIEVSEDEGTVLLASYDVDLDQVVHSEEYRAQKTLRLGMIREVFEYSQSHNVLFIFDTCITGNYELSEQALQISINWVFANRNPGRVVLSSCLSVEEGLKDRDTSGHGLFASYLLAALEGRALEAKTAEGTVTVKSLFNYLRGVMPDNYRPVLSSDELNKLVIIGK